MYLWKESQRGERYPLQETLSCQFSAGDVDVVVLISSCSPYLHQPSFPNIKVVMVAAMLMKSRNQSPHTTDPPWRGVQENGCCGFTTLFCDPSTPNKR